MRPSMIAMPATPPMTMPTMAPVERPEEEELEDVLVPDPDPDPEFDPPRLGLTPPLPKAAEAPDAPAEAVAAAVKPLTCDAVAAAWLIPPALFE